MEIDFLTCSISLTNVKWNAVTITITYLRAISTYLRAISTYLRAISTYLRAISTYLRAISTYLCAISTYICAISTYICAISTYICAISTYICAISTSADVQDQFNIQQKGSKYLLNIIFLYQRKLWGKWKPFILCLKKFQLLSYFVLNISCICQKCLD